MLNKSTRMRKHGTRTESAIVSSEDITGMGATAGRAGNWGLKVVTFIKEILNCGF